MNGLPKWMMPACLLMLSGILFSLTATVQADALTDKKKVERELNKLSTQIGAKKRNPIILITR